MIEFLSGGLGQYLILFAACVVLFERAMYCGYTVDDVNWCPIVKRHWQELKEKKIGVLRFIKDCTYGGGIFRNARQEYLFNIVLHFINCCLILKLTSLIPALLYLVNPVNNQTSLWINGRRYALSIFCVLMAWNFKVLAILFYPFSAWIHVSALAMPILFLTTEYWPYALAMIGIGFWFAYKHLDTLLFRKSEFVENNENQKIKPEKLILYVKSVGYYFFHCLLPFKPSMFHRFLFYFGAYEKDTKKAYSFDLDFLKGSLVIMFLGYEIIVNHNIWALWFIVFISSWCNLYTVTMNAADRYCSLANIGLMVILSQYINKIPVPYNMFVLGIFLSFYVIKYIPLFRAYRSEEEFLIYHVNQEPDNIKASCSLARYYAVRNQTWEAYCVLKRCLKYNPNDFECLMTMGDVLYKLNKIQHALNVFSIAERFVRIGEEKECKIFFDGLRAKYPPKVDKEVKEPVMNREAKRKFRRAKVV